VTLAVVPVGAMSGLHARLEGVPLASVVQHGVDHHNRRTGPAAGEFDIHPHLEAALTAANYRGWSASGELAPNDGLPRLDVHLDLMRWRGGSRFRGRGKFLRDFAKELRRRRKAELWTAPIGLLTHHQAHDTAAWNFLREFLTWSRAEPNLTWVSLPELVTEARTRRTARGGPAHHRIAGPALAQAR
jgi:hypothetical protein